MMALDMVKNSSGTPTLLMGGNDGYIYEVGAPDGTTWDDGFVSGTVSISHSIQGSYLGYRQVPHIQFDRVRVFLKGLTPMTGVLLDYASTGNTETMTAQTSTAGTLSLWDQAVWDSSVWSGIGPEVVLEWGINGYGRYLLPRVTHAQVGERFGLNGLECDAYILATEPVTV
jgi:hypothetical protein